MHVGMVTRGHGRCTVMKVQGSATRQAADLIGLSGKDLALSESTVKSSCCVTWVDTLSGVEVVPLATCRDRDAPGDAVVGLGWSRLAATSRSASWSVCSRACTSTAPFSAVAATATAATGPTTPASPNPPLSNPNSSPTGVAGGIGSPMTIGTGFVS